MPFLTDLQVEAIKSHMTSDPAVLNIKFKAKNTPNVTVSVPHGEREGYEAMGYTVVNTLKTKVKMSCPKKASTKFEDDIWCLFYKLGFGTLNTDDQLVVQWGDKESDRHQLDVVAIGEDAIFVVECKAAEEWKPKSFKDEIDVIIRYREGVTKALRQIYGNKKVKFIFATRKYRIVEGGEDEKRLRENKIFHLNDNTFDYITNLIKSYKESVIYQFYGLMFKDEMISPDRIKIPALQGTMGGRKYYLFSIEPHTLLKIGFVLHRTRVNDSMAPTYQRLLVPSRLKGITKFIDGGGYFPNSIIINFSASSKKLQVYFEAASKSDDTNAKFGNLYIPNAYGIAYIIDGQHRVYGYAASKYKDNNTIPVVAFENMESEEQLKIFMEINENQKAVSPSLRLDLEEDLYWSAGRVDSRMKALRSSIIKRLAASPNYVLYNKISIGEDSAVLAFKPFDTAFSKSGLIPSATQTKWTGDTDICIYDISETNNDKAMRDSQKRIAQFVNAVYSIIEENLDKAKQEDYLFSNRATFAIIALIGSIHKYLIKSDVINKASTIPERIEAIKPYFVALSQSLTDISEEDNAALKGFLGSGADTFWLRYYQNFVNKSFPDYNPEELVVWRETQNEDIQKEGQSLKTKIREQIKTILFSVLEEIYGERKDNSLLRWKNECENRIIKIIGDNSEDSLDNYDWTEYLEISDLKEIIDRDYSNESISSAFSIDIGEGFRTKKEKLAWLSKVDLPKGKKHDALTQADLNKLWLISNHLSQFVDE